MHKDEVIERLREMADLLEITDANAFEVMAHRNAAQSLEDWFGDLEEAAAENKLTEIPAVGKGLGKVIADLVKTGASDELTRVRALVPPGLPAILRIRGLGPKRVRTLWRQLNIESPDDLRRAADDGRVQSLRGFGAKLVEQIRSGLDYLQKSEARPAKKIAAEKIALTAAPKSTGRIWAGMSGFSYPKWKGQFYPEGMRAEDFLAFYATQLATVELNNTFYRFPSEQVVGGWRAQAPAHFRFAIKANRRITHQMRLGPSSAKEIVQFVERCGQFGARLGCILFQLPPNFARDDARLRTLLDALPAGPRYAVEFRHESWFADEVQEKLRARNIACVSGDSQDRPTRQLATADFVYVRLRRGTYTDGELDAWHAWFVAQVEQKRDVLVYLKHDDDGSAPNILLSRWGQAKPPAAREILQKTLARPVQRTPKRPRKTG